MFICNKVKVTRRRHVKAHAYQDRGIIPHTWNKVQLYNPFINQVINSIIQYAIHFFNDKRVSSPWKRGVNDAAYNVCHALNIDNRSWLTDLACARKAATGSDEATKLYTACSSGPAYTHHISLLCFALCVNRPLFCPLIEAFTIQHSVYLPLERVQS